MQKVHVYMACSLDGFIAGPDGDLSWLHSSHALPGDLAPDPKALRFEAFMSQVGALLMGRTTYEVVAKMGNWPYGETPVVVATRRPLIAAAPTVRALAGEVASLVQRAKIAAGEKDVYIDGGDLVRQALNASLVDEITITLVPILLGGGSRLFEHLDERSRLQFLEHRSFDDGLVQIRARVVHGISPASR